MRTTKPIATISFNTTDYLSYKLNELLKNGKLSFWAFIQHKPEDDEGGKKYHHHVYVEPAKMLQTDDLKKELNEFDSTNPTKPKGCITWNSSKFADWYLYALHDSKYLAMKGQSRKFQYSATDMLSSDLDDLTFKVRSIDLIALSPFSAMEDAIDQGLTFQEYFRRGTTPIPLVSQYQKAWEMLCSTQTFRNGRVTHSPVVTEDGELIDE